MNYRGDEELDTLVRATIAGGGVIPHIHKALIKKILGEDRLPARKPTSKAIGDVFTRGDGNNN